VSGQQPTTPAHNVMVRARSYYLNPYLLVLLLPRLVAPATGLLQVTRPYGVLRVGLGQLRLPPPGRRQGLPQLLCKGPRALVTLVGPLLAKALRSTCSIGAGRSGFSSWGGGGTLSACSRSTTRGETSSKGARPVHI